jgi:predicted enzyme related to lactoylglutathione lyase
MSVIEKHAPGSFCWVELGTTNASAAKAFYNSLFGWKSEDMPMGPDQFYTMLNLGGKTVGALYNLDKNMQQMGIPPHWMLYVAVSKRGPGIGQGEDAWRDGNERAVRRV